MSEMIMKELGSYILHAEDGVRTISRDLASHKLVGTLTTPPTIGEVVIRFLTDAETAEYARIRKAEKNSSRLTKKAKADKARKAEEKAAARKARQEKLAEQKAQQEAKAAREQAVVDLLDRSFDYVKYTEELTKVKYFTKEDRMWDRENRRSLNVRSSEQLGHPAQASASVFCEYLMSVEALVGKNPGELGGKKIFAAIRKRKDALDDLVAQKEELGKSLDAAEDRHTAECKLRSIRGEIRELRAEIRLLAKAAQELEKGVTDAERELFRAWRGVYNKRVNDKKKTEVGREVIPCAKPELKGYKFMHFTSETFADSFRAIIAPVNAAGDKCVEAYDAWQNGEGTEDEFVQSQTELRKAFKAGLVALREYKLSGKKVFLRAEKAKIFNGRQSYLTDMIGVQYGQTTDMLVTFAHNVAKIFNKGVTDYICDDQDEGRTELNKFRELIISVLTNNGGEVISLPNEEGKRMRKDFLFWNANNAQLKVGKGVALSKEAHAKAMELARAGMTPEEYEGILTNGADMLKYLSYAMTPGCPLEYKGEPLTANDVLVVDSIETVRKFYNVWEFMKDGTIEKHDIGTIERTAFDGSLFFLVPIPSQQLRGAMCFKGFGLCCAYEDGTTMVDEIARREGLDIPEFIEDVDHVMRRWRDYKVICTKDAWKWAGWSWEDGSKFKYADFCSRMNKLAEKYPGANSLYTARIADATEESRRQLTRQSIQQFLFATVTQLMELGEKSVKRIKKLMTHAGVIRVMAGLDKPEDQRTAFEHLVEVYPELLDHPYMKRAVEDMFHRKVAEAAVRPDVTGIYPYIAEDPVAFFKIVFWKADPNKVGIGYIGKGCCNVPNTADNVPMYICRYPNNFLCGMVRKQKNDRIYRCVGNVMILSLDGGTLTKADGDTDGDEMCVIFDRVVVDMMADVIRELNPPMIKFPHDKLEKLVIRGKEARADAIAHAIVIANEYGPAVGQNSNLATRFFQRASMAHMEWQQAEDKEIKRKALWKRNKALEGAMIAHVSAIIAIDLAKTGSMPEWLEPMLNEVSKYAGFDMPWNQRFCKDNKKTPWYDAAYWDDRTMAETESVCDQFARYVIDVTGAEQYVAPTGNEFELETLLGDKLGLDTRGSQDVITLNNVRRIEARNYRTKLENSEGDDEYKLISDMQAGLHIGGSELARFLWRNQASLVYVLQREGGDKLENAMMQNAYYEFCHDLLWNFGCNKGNKVFKNRSIELQRASNVWKFVELGFREDNGVGNKATTKEEAATKKASFCLFLVKVFAYDLYLVQCERKGITPWQKPTTSTASDDAEVGYVENDSMNIGYDDGFDYCGEVA